MKALLIPVSVAFLLSLKGVRADDKGYPVDFIRAHGYGQNDPEKFIERLEAVHKLYDMPIWITEFAIAHWSAKKQQGHPKDVPRFM